MQKEVCQSKLIIISASPQHSNPLCLPNPILWDWRPPKKQDCYRLKCKFKSIKNPSLTCTNRNLAHPWKRNLGFKLKSYAVESVEDQTPGTRYQNLWKSKFTGPLCDWDVTEDVHVFLAPPEAFHMFRS